MALVLTNYCQYRVDRIGLLLIKKAIGGACSDPLFVVFDEYFKDWNPADDALKLAADLVNDGAFPSVPAEIAERYGWPGRRLNPAIAYLDNRDLAAIRTGLAMDGWAAFDVKQKKDVTRRFVKSRSRIVNGKGSPTTLG